MSEERADITQPASPPKAMVVGIGASAGGLKALKKLFSLLPGDSGLSYVVVVHLSPEHPSHLADLLQPSSRMPVVQVSGTTPLEPNHVYVIPPGRNLSTIDTHLRLSELEKQRRERAPIDHFFETLATTHQDQCIGLILSGTGSDGTLGIKKIKEGGGVTIVQEPNEAEFDGMPQSAIATELVDLVLPIKDIPDYILRISRTHPRVPDSEEAIPENEEQILQHIFAHLRARTGQDFSKYKRSTVLRRLRRRMQLQQQERLEDYLVQLREHPQEVRLLAEDFLITVTQFFRDEETYEYLEKKVIPALFKVKEAGEKLRIWSVGCATGEEAYSLAMLLLESLSHASCPLELQIFASDLHEHSLHRAREGTYPETISGDVSPERLKRFFTKEDNSYRIRKDLREIVVFANHNLLKDPPFSHMDLIVCRNVLIYLQRDAQHDVMDLFHYALNPDGLLLLGPSETVDRAGLFRVESKKHAVYRRRNVPPPEPRLPVFFNPFRRERAGHPPLPQAPPPAISYGGLHQKIVERHAPPSILVNEEGQAVHISRHAGRYLRIAGGDLSSSIYKLTREELRLELRSALQAAASSGKPVRSKPVVLRLDGEPRQVFIQVHPARNEDTEGFFLVLFDETDGVQTRVAVEGAAEGDQGTELESLSTQLRTVVEQYETSQEEMKAANEELQSSNEELRSAMEELETSKEELQSMNEELQTVNQENRHKVEELSQITADLNNLMSATEIATLFLDQDLRILRVMPLIPDLFNIRGSDRGRPLTDFTNRFGYDRLVEDAERVLERLVPIEREVRSQDGKWYMMRILPYRSGDRIKGVVITFIEITERRRAEMALRESEERFRALVNAGSDIIYRMGPDWMEMRELDGRGLIADTVTTTTEWLDKYIAPADRPMVEKAIRHAVKHKEKFELEHRVILADGSFGWMLSRAIPVLDEKGDVREWFGAASDITARKQAEEVLREADVRKDQFLATLGHELRNPLAPIRTALELLKQRLPDDPDLQDLRQMMERQVLVMRRLVDDLLDVSRIKSGRVLLQNERLDLRDIVENAAASIEQAARNKRHRLDVSPNSESLVVNGDPLRLGQVITNLLDNAVKYTPPDGHIRVMNHTEDGHAVVSVRDNGIGIPENMLGQVFDLFTQGGRATGYGGGLGIGLTLVRQLVEMHGGRIEALSEGEGQGSEFIVRLPLAGDKEEEHAPPHIKSKRASRPAPGQPRPCNILLVEDNQDVANSLAMALTTAGHNVCIATDGATALKQAGKYTPDVALIDIGLPDMDGHAVARELHSSKSPPRLLIAISGYGQHEDRARSANSGIDHHLVKPVDTAELLRLIAGGGKGGKKKQKREEKN